MDRNLYDSRIRNLSSWVGHLGPRIADATTQATDELGPPGEVALADARRASAALAAIARGLHEVMNAHDLLLDSVGRPRRFEDFLQDLALTPTAAANLPAELEINRAEFNRLVAELHFDTGWLSGAIQSALIGFGEEHLDAQLDGFAAGIEELMISYDRLQHVLGVTPARHCAYFDQMVVLDEGSSRGRRPRAKA